MRTYQRRRGSSLIELMVVMSLSSTLLFIAVGWIHQSMKLASSMRVRSNHHATLLNLSRQLRDDVQHGASMTLQDDTRLVIAMTNGRSVTYRINSAGVSRSVTEDGRVTAGEQYAVDAPHSVRWDGSELPDWISLTVVRGTKTASPGPPESSAASGGPPRSGAVADLHVRTRLGRALRWGPGARGPGASEEER